MAPESLRSTTALILTLSLMQPLPMAALAQEGREEPAEGLLRAIDAGADPAAACREVGVDDREECRLFLDELAGEEAGQVAEEPDEAEAASKSGEEAETEAPRAADSADSAGATDSEVKADSEAESAVDVDAKAEVGLESEAEADLESEQETAVDDEAEVEAEAETEADMEAEAEAEPGVEAEAEATAETETEAEAEAETDAQEGAVAQPEETPEDPADETPDDRAGSPDEAATESPEPESAEEAETSAEELREALEDAEREADESASDSETTEEETPVAEPAESTIDEVPEDEAAEEADPAPTPEQEDTAATSEERDEEVVAEECAAEIIAMDGTIVCADDPGSAVIAAIEGDAEQEEAEVTTETVTEETRRSSDEEFAEPSEADTESRERDGGLTDLQRAGLLAIGAFAAGAILSDGRRVESNTGDRVVVVDDAGRYQVYRDDDTLLRQPGSEVRTERFSDGSMRTVVERPDGARIVTIRDSSGRLLRRSRVEPDGREFLLVDDTRRFEPVVVSELPPPAQRSAPAVDTTDHAALRRALAAAERRDIDRTFSLRQVREIREVRELAPEISIESITFATNSAAVAPSQAPNLRQIGLLMREMIAENPSELFLIEGHTDAVGPAGYNLLLSDRRAESVALALTEYFDVPSENMVIQGYGEEHLKIPTQEAERRNRRVVIRPITSLAHGF